MFGLSGSNAADASLLLNSEGVLAALLVWSVFKGNFDCRIALGMLAIVAGGLVLTWPRGGGASVGAGTGGGSVTSALLVIGACLAWAIDNNLTRELALLDGGFIAMSKGLVAGSVNMVQALLTGASLPTLGSAAQAAVLGFASYGASLVLFVLALRHLGTARTGAYFSVAPFAGALLALPLLGEPLRLPLLALGLMFTRPMRTRATSRRSRWPPGSVTAMNTSTCRWRTAMPIFRMRTIGTAIDACAGAQTKNT